jgi:transposase
MSDSTALNWLPVTVCDALAGGAVLATCKARHRHQEFLSFLRKIDKAVPADLDVHCIVDNYSAHKHPKVKAWLEARPGDICISYRRTVRGLIGSNASSR